jgi:hypothetical protein
MAREAAKGGYATVRQRERLDPYVQAQEDAERTAKEGTATYQARLAEKLARQTDFQKGPTQTINVRDKLAGSAGQTAQAARAAGAGAAETTADLNARLRESSVAKIRSELEKAKERASAAKQRQLGALSTVGRTKGGAFVGDLAMGGLTGAVKGLNLSEQVAALQGRNA